MCSRNSKVRCGNITSSHPALNCCLFTPHTTAHASLSLAMMYTLMSGHITPCRLRVAQSTDERMRPSRYVLRLLSDTSSSDSLSYGS